MAFGTVLAVVAVALAVASFIMVRNVKKPGGEQKGLNFDENSIPTASEGEIIPVLFGTRQIKKSNVIMHGNYKWVEITWGGKKDKKKAVMYHLTWHSVVAIGRLDAIRSILFDDLIVWGAGFRPPTNNNGGGKQPPAITGGVLGEWVEEDDNIVPAEPLVPLTFGVDKMEYIYIDQEDILGGREKEGGYRGGVVMSFGDEGFVPVTWGGLYKKRDTPLYNGVTTIYFSDFYYGLSPYLKPMSVIASRIMYDWRGKKEQWYPEKAAIDVLDMNPAHIIREIILAKTPDYGVALDDDKIDEDSFRRAADTLYDEKFGLSLLWEDDDDSSEMLKRLESHIAGKVFPDRRTRKIKIKLYRDDYQFNNLRVLTYNEISDLISYKEATFEDLLNHVSVTYWDRGRLQKGVVTQSNAALYEITGVTNAHAINYPYICTQELAAKVALRDLKMVSTPLVRLEIECDRSAFDLELGDVIRVQMPDDNVPDVAFRVNNLTYDTEMNYVKVQMLQDVFGYPKSILHKFSGDFGSYQSDRSARDPAGILIEEVSKMDLFKINKETNILSKITPKLSMLTVSAANASTETGWYFSKHVGNKYLTNPEMQIFDEVSYLRNAIASTTTKIELINPMYNVELGSIIVIDNERMIVASYDLPNGIMQVIRGVEDTHAVSHKVNSQIMSQCVPYLSDMINVGEDLTYKITTTNGVSRQAVAAVGSHTTRLKGRHFAPYPPQAIRINGEFNPVEITAFIEGVPPTAKTYFTLSAQARSNKIEDYSIHWFSDVANIDPDVKYFYEVEGFINKTEFTADGTPINVYMNHQDMNRANVKVWSETLQGVRNYYDYEHILRLSEFRNNLYTFNYKKFEFTNTKKNYLNSYDDSGFQNIDGKNIDKQYVMFSYGIVEGDTPYLRIPLNGEAVNKIKATFKLGSYRNRTGRVNIQMIAYKGDNEVLQSTETGVQGNWSDNKLRDFELEINQHKQVDYIDLRFVFERSDYKTNSLGFTDLIIEKV